MTADFSQFAALDIRVGTIIEAEDFPKAHRPAYKLYVDFGPEIGTLQSSAQITDLYSLDDLRGRQVMGVVNFEPKQIADIMSQCLVLGVYTEQGVVLLSTERPCKNGEKLG